MIWQNFPVSKRTVFYGIISNTSIVASTKIANGYLKNSLDLIFTVRV